MFVTLKAENKQKVSTWGAENRVKNKSLITESPTQWFDGKLEKCIFLCVVFRSTKNPFSRKKDKTFFFLVVKSANGTFMQFSKGF